MEDGIKQLIDMVANLKITMLDKFDEIDKRFDEIDKRFDRIEEKFTNSLKLIGHDVQNNKRHIDKLENNNDYYNVSE